MSNSSRINKATSELNKAEERLLNSLGLSDEIIKSFKNNRWCLDISGLVSNLA
ncbi:hypothetical protein OFO01_01110 [Campylobacter sp. JMF_01 NE2]|uniref:hypothetical protein n=1 Tax=unclassified Campylobacter TaxID=2593542 RepID=UPI0022E9E700|nr:MULTISPECIES: hypothetical protein [unclassified Campylobacter]MDA3052053.1 hypothetical protein [Campylobacter sp. JMF_03 NE3]MDA3066387.1 hypothetical protein [Campylobacter sp. JMF_01 NE2]